MASAPVEDRAFGPASELGGNGGARERVHAGSVCWVVERGKELLVCTIPMTQQDP